MRVVMIAQSIVLLIVLPLLLSTTFLLIFATTSPTMVHLLPAGPYPGDMVIPDAVMVYDQTRLVQAPPEAVWPWILQVGKGRGGWYVS